MRSTFQYGTFNYLSGIPNNPLLAINLGDRNPDYVKKVLGLVGLRKELFPQVSSTFRYWQFAVWCEKYDSRMSANQILEIRSRLQGVTIGPRSVTGIQSGAQWLSNLKQLSVNNMAYQELVQFIEKSSKKVLHLPPRQGFEFSIELAKNSRLDLEWRRKIKKTLTPAARELYFGKKRHPDLRLDEYLQGIVIGKYSTNEDKLIKAAAIFGALRALYGYQELDYDEYGNIKQGSMIRGVEKVNDERNWAKCLIIGMSKNKRFPDSVRSYRTELIKTQRSPKGAAWNDIWKKTNNQKKLLIGFKFNRFFAVVDHSCYRGGTNE